MSRKWPVIQGFPKYERRNPNVKIAPYAARLIKALETDARRPKRDRRTALKLFGELQAAGFTGTYCRITEFIRHWRADGGAAVSKAFVPLRRGLPLIPVSTGLKNTRQ